MQLIDITDQFEAMGISVVAMTYDSVNMLKTVDAVSDDMYWECNGYCGKKQPMVVSLGGPAIRAEANLGRE